MAGMVDGYEDISNRTGRLMCRLRGWRAVWATVHCKAFSGCTDHLCQLHPLPRVLLVLGQNSGHAESLPASTFIHREDGRALLQLTV